MKRVCIFPIFDKDGIFDESVLFFIRSLKEVVERLIIVVIGFITNDSLLFLKKYTNEILIKDNCWFYAEAVKYCFKNYLPIDELDQYDELIIANDTNFGPFIPFEKIFADMEQKDCDFWGMNFTGTRLLSHIQSDFRVFKKRTFSFLHGYIMQNNSMEDADKSNIVITYEFNLYKRLIDSGFKAAWYSSRNNNYNLPYNSLVNGHPFLKVRAFSFYDQNKDQCDKALEFVLLKYGYDIDLIVSKIKRKYGINLVRPLVPEFSDYSCCEKDLQNFIAAEDGFYIYGAGRLAKWFFSYYKDLMHGLKGFIVSDPPKVTELFGYAVVPVSELKDPNIRVIVAMSEQNSIDAAPLLKKFRNKLFLHEVE